MITIYAFSNLPPFAIGLSRDLRALWAAEETGLPGRDSTTPMNNGLPHNGL